MDRKKVRKGCLIAVIATTLVFVIGLIIMIVLVTRGVSFGKIEVDYSRKDLKSGYEKLNIENDDNTPSINDLLSDNFIVSNNPVPVDTVLSNEEITAILDDLSDKDDYITNIQVNMIDDDLFEMTFELNNIEELLSEESDLEVEIENLAFALDFLEGTEVYYKGSVEYSDEKGIELDFDKLKLGVLPIQSEAADTAIDLVEELINTAIDKMPALTIDVLQVTEDGLEFVGTIPDEIDKE